MSNPIMNWYEDLTADKKSSVKKFSVLTIAILLLYGFYSAKESKQSSQPKPENQKTQVDVMGDRSVFDDDIREEARKFANQSDSKIKELEASQQAILDMLEKNFNSRNDPQPHPSSQSMTPQISTGSQPSSDFQSYASSAGSAYPPSIPQNYQPSGSGDASGDPSAPEKIIGGITRAQGVPFSEKKDTGKEGVNKFYLSPSFMKGVLLEGIEMPSSKGGKKNPRIALFRIQKPAILPNNVKAQLKGCFVTTSVTASLNSERIDFRTSKLHCISLNDQTLINESIQGHVNDAFDGKQGISARVVMRAGASLGRAFFADFFGSFGSAYKESVSNSGITTATNGTISSQKKTSKELLTSGIGGGVQGSSNFLKDFYKEILEQTSPTLESGSGRDVFIVLTDGVWLNIKSMTEAQNEEPLQP